MLVMLVMLLLSQEKKKRGRPHKAVLNRKKKVSDSLVTNRGGFEVGSEWSHGSTSRKQG